MNHAASLIVSYRSVTLFDQKHKVKSEKEKTLFIQLMQTLVKCRKAYFSKH